MTVVNRRNMPPIISKLGAGIQALATKRVAEPTYFQDRVGEIEQWDERDIVFSRSSLWSDPGPDSSEFKAYYERHPEYLGFDTKISKMPELGRTGGVDSAMLGAQYVGLPGIVPTTFVDRVPDAEKTEFPPERAAEKIKALAQFIGADLVGIGPLRQEWVYSHVGFDNDSKDFRRRGNPIDIRHHSNAIALGFRMNYDLIRCAPDFPILLATVRGYALGAWVSAQLAEYIRTLGYSAWAHHVGSYLVNCVPIAVDCGLGELSRAGFLITKEFGLGLRLAIVTTDMPLTHDGPVDLGVQSFCTYCKICAEECPIGAIPYGDKVAYNGVKKWKLDEEKCYRHWRAVGTDCGLCMVSCPWTKPENWLHKTIALPATVSGPHQWLMTQADKLFYGKFRRIPRPDFMEAGKRKA